MEPGPPVLRADSSLSEPPVNPECVTDTQLRLALCNPWTVASQALLFMELSRQEDSRVLDNLVASEQERSGATLCSPEE